MFKQLKKDGITFNFFVNLLFMSFAIMVIVPIVLCISITFSSKADIFTYGFTIIPKHFTLDAVNYVKGNISEILNAYSVTIIVTVVGTFLSVLITSMYAYVISRPDFIWRRFFNYFMYIPTLFSGGLVATYLWYTGIGLYNNLQVLILPSVFSAWNALILRTFFQTGVPISLIESAKLDGAGEFRVLFKIVMPISIPGIATITLFTALNYWNDWYTALIYIRNESLYGIQYYLQRIMMNLQMMLETGNTEMSIDIPSDSVRMFLCLVAMGPILLAYPFCQKFFIQGLTVGAVKG